MAAAWGHVGAAAWPTAPPATAPSSGGPFSMRPLPLLKLLYGLLWAQQAQQRALDEWHELAFALKEHGDVVVEGVVLAHL